MDERHRSLERARKLGPPRRRARCSPKSKVGFTEGFDTAGLKETKAPLDELSG
jgi:hypothetical protein